LPMVADKGGDPTPAAGMETGVSKADVLDELLRRRFGEAICRGGALCPVVWNRASPLYLPIASLTSGILVKGAQRNDGNRGRGD
jgi:hypothetical protein